MCRFLPRPNIRLPLLLMLCGIAAGCTDPAAAPTSSRLHLTGATMGTSYSIRLAALPDGVTAEELQSEVDVRLERVNDQMSTWRPDSELSRFNRSDAPDWFKVSADTVRVVTEAKRISELSGGAFDVTINPLIALWRFNTEERLQKLPDDAAIQAALGQTGHDRIAVRDDPPALKKSAGDLSVDLSAIAKGFGVDVIAEYLDDVGIEAYMVEIGGEVRTRGRKPDGTPWRVGVEAPLDGRRQLHGVIELVNLSLATSGDYRNFEKIDGKRYSHTLDPRTGRPVEHQLASVSVLHQECMAADGLATALMVLGPVDGYNWADEHGIPALFIIREDDGTLRETATPAFQGLDLYRRESR